MGRFDPETSVVQESTQIEACIVLQKATCPMTKEASIYVVDVSFVVKCVKQPASWVVWWWFCLQVSVSELSTDCSNSMAVV